MTSSYRSPLSLPGSFVVVVIITSVLCLYFFTFGDVQLLPYVRRIDHDGYHSAILSPHEVNGRATAQFGYVLAMRYTGQQGTGIQALMSLQCFIGSFNLPMFILEPVMNETFFESRLRMNTNYSSLLKFSDMFDVTHFNKASRRMGFSELRPQSELYTRAPIKVILVDSRRSGKDSVKLVWNSQEGKECYVDEDVPEHFCIVRVVSVAGKHDLKSNYQIFSEKEVFSIVFGPWSPKSITLIFKRWETPWYVPNSNLADPHKCKNIRSLSTETQFHTSSKLLRDAQSYEQRFLKSKNRLAIMFRLERMIIHLRTLHHKHDGIDDHVRSCLNKVVDVSKSIWRKNKEYSRPLVTLDLGKYGSISWEGRHQDTTNITRQMKSTFSKLFTDGWSFDEWEQSFTQVASIPDNKGYIAAFQRTLASQADCLVLIGGGYFQELALNDYKRNHPDRHTWCVHVICAINSKRLEQNVNGNVMGIFHV